MRTTVLIIAVSALFLSIMRLAIHPCQPCVLLTLASLVAVILAGYPTREPDHVPTHR